MTIYSFIVLFSYMSGMLHAFHVSVCEISPNTENKTLEITQRIFLDDLEQALILWTGNSKTDVLNPDDKAELDSLIGAYVMEHFEINLDSKSIDTKYLGAKVKEDIMLVFIEVEKVKKWSAMTIKNTILMELFADQINLIHLNQDGQTTSLKLDPRQTSDTFYLK